MEHSDTHLEEALDCLDDRESVKKILATCDIDERTEVNSCVQLANALRAHRHELDPSHELLSKTLHKLQGCRGHPAVPEPKARAGIRAWLQPRSAAVFLVAVIAVLGGLAAWRNAAQQDEVAVQTPTTNEPNAVNVNTASSATAANSNIVTTLNANAGNAQTSTPQGQPALDTTALAALAGSLGTGLNAYEQDSAALQGLAGDQALTNAGGDLAVVDQL